MNTLHAGQIVDRIVTAVLEGADVGTWVESNHPWPDFPPGKDSGDVTSLSFVVGALGSPFEDDDRQRRRGANARGAALTTTDIAVRFLYQVQSDDKQGSYREFLAREAELVRLVMGTDADPDLEIRASGVVDRGAAYDGVLLCEMGFTVRHFYPLTL